MVRITQDTDVELATERLDEEELDALSFVLDVEVDASETAEPTLCSCKVNVERLLRVMTVFDSANSFRYDWRRTSERSRAETREDDVRLSHDASGSDR